MLLLMSFIIFHVIAVSTTLNWIQSNISVTANSQSFIGYHSTSNSILILGGWGTPTMYVEFEPHTKTTTNDTGINYGRSLGQSWRQIGELLYMLPENSLNMNLYNLSSNSFLNAMTQYPGTSKYHRCMTSFDFNQSQYLVITGGDNGDTSLYTYNLLTNQWKNGPDLIQSRRDFACNVVNDVYYIIGGRSNNIYLNTVQIISTSSLLATTTDNAWSTMHDILSDKKDGHRSAVYHNVIYVLGGWNGNSLKSVDIIDTLSQTIVPDADLLDVNYYQQVVIVDHILYSFGGHNAVTDSYQYAVIPTYNPTSSPTNNPILSPTTNLTIVPSPTPTSATSYPTIYPTKLPTSVYPTVYPTTNPTIAPSSTPTSATSYPSNKPTLKYISATFDPSKSPFMIMKSTNSINIQNSTVAKRDEIKASNKTSYILAVVIVLTVSIASFVCGIILYKKKKKTQELKYANSNDYKQPLITAGNSMEYDITPSGVDDISNVNKNNDDDVIQTINTHWTDSGLSTINDIDNNITDGYVELIQYDDKKTDVEIINTVNALFVTDDEKMILTNQDKNDGNEDLQIDNKENIMQNQLECVVCMDKKPEYACVPCGHQCLCQNCKDVINNQCPICLAKCTNVIKIFK